MLYCTVPLYLNSRTSILLLARYVPNVAKRSTWEQCNIEDDRPTDRPRISENFERSYLCNGSSDPLHVWFYGRVFEVGGSNGATSGWKNPRWRPSVGRRLLVVGRRRSLIYFEWPYLRNCSSNPIRIWFYGKSMGENNARGVIRLVTI